MTTIPSPRVRAAARLGLLLAAAAAAGCAPDADAPATDAAAGDSAALAAPAQGEWVQLFNGRDLEGWQLKFTGYPLGENPHNTVRVEDGLLKIRYDGWSGWDGAFGHIFHEQPYSHYLLAAEYRFVGGQVPGAPPELAWAIRNNGLMLHSQSAESMGLDQDFPISMEVQLLGGAGDGTARSTANLCTPGTHVVLDGELDTRHCIESSSATYHGDQWVRVEVLVLGDSIVKHIVEGDTVLTYTRPQMGGGNVANAQPGLLVEGTPLTAGHIALQAETAEIDFRKVEIRELR